MPVTTILQHATGREIPVKTETDSDTHMSNDEDNLISRHMPVQASLDTTESCSPKDSQASNAKKPAPATSPSSSHQPKQPRKTSASRRRRKSRSSSTQIASETGQYTLVAENLPSAEPIPLGASSCTPFGMSNGTTTYEQSPKGTWEPQLTYCHTPPASSIDYTNEEAVPNTSVAAEDVLNPDNIQSTTASPSTNQSSGQRSSFASSSGQTSPSSYFTAHSSPKGYKPAQASLEVNNTSVSNNTPSAAWNNLLIYFIESWERASCRHISADNFQSTAHSSTSSDKFSRRRRSSASRGSFTAGRKSAASKSRSASANYRASATCTGRSSRTGKSESEFKTTPLISAETNSAFLISSICSIESTVSIPRGHHKDKLKDSTIW